MSSNPPHFENWIKVRGANEHNLKNVDVDIPCNKLVVITGLSGSGKSSLAFDTIYAEGQRRYVESLSAYARQFLQLQNKPDVTSISGLSPAIAIDQKTTSKNPRSTVGTVTEINDYLRLLFARVGVPFSPSTNLPIKSQTVGEMVDSTLNLPQGSKIYVLAPIANGKKGEFKKELELHKKQGFDTAIIDEVVFDLHENLPLLEKTKTHNISIVIDKITLDLESKSRLAQAFETALQMGNGIAEIKINSLPEDLDQAKVESIQNKNMLFSERYSCPVSGFQIPALEPRLFSFNSPFGACPGCQGLGHIMFFAPDLIAPDHSISIKDGAIKCFVYQQPQFVAQILGSVVRHFGHTLDTPLNMMSQKVLDTLFFGSEEEIEFLGNTNNRSDKTRKPFEGIIPYLVQMSKSSSGTFSEDLFHKYQEKQICSDCSGHRLRWEALCVRIAQLHIGQVLNMDIESMAKWIENLHNHLTEKENTVAKQLLKEIGTRLGFLNSVGLGYLTLSRMTSTLSGGESQRIRLASQIGSGLSGVLYVLDEPSIGLHQRDNQKLIQTLLHLRDLGNTVIVVEHDSETMFASDYLIDFGPGAGIHGGEVVAYGTIDEIISNKKSLTGQYLSGEKSLIARNKKPNPGEPKFLELKGARSHNLKNIDIKIPIGSFSVVTGVSGSGKSTLILETLYPAVQRAIDTDNKIKAGEFDSLTGVHFFNKVVEIDQSPIGKTPRSNPATYVGIFSLVRDFFSMMSESKVRGYKVGRFSFNVKGGRCEACKGDGLIKIEMHFLQDVYVKCDVCFGARYNKETLSIKYKGKSISEILDMTVEDSLKFFENTFAIWEKINVLNKVGLGYLKLGQSSTTLSGGEAQRIKLAKELSKRSTGKTLYILDEPTTGLHYEDINKLLAILYDLVDLGNTVVVIEHNIDVIKRADYIIDIGPEGGDKGGYVIASGTPEIIAQCPESITGRFLDKVVDPI
jgi:excinuclease ABC subunit A